MISCDLWVLPLRDLIGSIMNKDIITARSVVGFIRKVCLMSEINSFICSNCGEFQLTENPLSMNFQCVCCLSRIEVKTLAGGVKVLRNEEYNNIPIPIRRKHKESFLLKNKVSMGDIHRMVLNVHRS